MPKISWELVGDSAAVAYDVPRHPRKPKVLAWVSVVDPECLHRCMIGIGRALEYGKVPNDVRTELRKEAPHG
jgi:hypothetical protein